MTPSGAGGGLEPPFLSDNSLPAALATTHVHCAVCGADDAPVVATGYDYEYRTSRQPWRYGRCAQCGLVYVNPRPAVEELGAIYPPNYYSFDETQRDSGLVRFFRRKLESMKVGAFHGYVGDGPKRVLDVGCGDGRFLGCLRDFGPGDWVLEGIDIDAGAVDRARAKGFAARLARLEDFEPEDGRYDMVVLFQVIEHVSEPAAMCRKVHALLEPGGVFVVETPDVAGWDERLFRTGLWGGYHIPRHWNLFPGDVLQRMLEQEGFEVVGSQPLISTSFWINSLYNWLLVRGAPKRLLRFFHYQNPLLLAPFLLLDKVRIALGGRTSNQRMVARRRR